MTSIRSLFALTSLALVAAGANSYAQNIPPQGSLSVTFTATQIPPAKPMPIGDGKEFTVINLAMTASNDAGNPILNNMGGRCQFSRIVDAAKRVEQHGFCTYTDDNSAEIFEKCDFLPGSPNTCKLTGGTGKFEGLRADLVIAAAPVKSNYGGILQVIGHKKGTYRFVKTAAQ